MGNRANGKVLIVGDYARISDIVAAYKSHSGRKPIIVPSGEEALAVASEQANIDLLITDITMEENFARQFTQLCPDTNVLYMIL